MLLHSTLRIHVYGEVQTSNHSEYQSFILLQNILSLISCRAVKAGDFAEKGWPDDEAYSVSNLGDTLLARAYQQEFNSVSERDIVVNAVSI